MTFDELSISIYSMEVRSASFSPPFYVIVCRLVKLEIYYAVSENFTILTASSKPSLFISAFIVFLALVNCL